MHELSIASAVVDSVLEFIAERSVKRVISVKLAVGELSHVEEEQLQIGRASCRERVLFEV